MSEEKKLILQMLSEGKINVAEAEKLLEGAGSVQSLPSSGKSDKKFLKILVAEDGKNKVDVNIPIALAEIGLKLIPKDKLQIEGKQIDLQEILKSIKEGNQGNIVNIDTVDEGKAVRVQIFID